LAEKLAAVADKVEALATPEPDPEPEPPKPDADAMVQKLLENPSETISDIVKSEVADYIKVNVAPVVGRSMESRRDEFLEHRLQPELDSQFGAGFYEDHIKERLAGPQGILSKYTVDQQENPQVIWAAVRGLIGTDFMGDERATLLDRLKKVETKEREALEAPGGLPVGGSRPTPARVSPDIEDSLRRINEQGLNYSKEDFLADVARGSDWDSWKDAFPPSKDAA
jgi:hypothetical protein